MLFLYIYRSSSCLTLPDGGYLTLTDIITQLASYLDPINFPNDKGVPILGLTLTKYTVLHPLETSFVSMTWNEIIKLIRKFIESEKNSKNDVSIAAEYMNFLTGVGKGMNFFEVEVLSVAAGKTHGLEAVK
jgi:hypothetical protein